MPRDIAGTPYQSPYLLTLPQKVLPSDGFLLPICTTIERLLQMHMVLTYGATAIGCPRIGEHNIDFYEALAHIDAPEKTGCYKPKVLYYGGKKLPDCVELVDADGDGIHETINIYECGDNCMAVVNIYECGCGCGDTVSGSGGTGGAGVGTDGGFVGDGVGGGAGVSKCDVASYILPYVLDQAKEWFDSMDNYLSAGGNIADFFEEGTDTIDLTDVAPTIVSGLKSVIDALNGGVEQIVDMLEDTDFILEFQESWWRATSEDGALNGRIESLSRADLRRGNRYIPLTWGSPIDGAIVLPRVTLDLFFSIANMQKINRRLTLAGGQADTTLCTYLAAQIGETYTPPVIGENVPPPLLVIDLPTEGYRLTRLLENQVFENGVIFNTGSQTPEEAWVGILIEWKFTGNATAPGWLDIHVRDEANVVLAAATHNGRAVELGAGQTFADFFSVTDATTRRNDIIAGDGSPSAFIVTGKSLTGTLNDGAPITEPIDPANYNINVDADFDGILLSVWQVELLPE